ncbi:hypothetical protein FRB90_010941 [Tulasnella sp. 427]|nr:hypothetical protein FRB90_010941 [Tulasnella sp. 427]
MSHWEEVRDTKAATSDSEDGWTEALGSPEVKSPASEPISDNYVDLDGNDHERFVPDGSQESTSGSASRYESAPEDDPMEGDDDEELDTEDWDTYSAHTVTLKKQAEDTAAADELLAIQVAEQIRRDIMDAEVARWLSEAPFPDHFDVTFENLLAHGFISPEVLDMLDQVDPSGLNPSYRVTEKVSKTSRQAHEEELRAARLDIINTYPTPIAPLHSVYSEQPKPKEQIIVYLPKVADPEGPLVLAICSICKGHYRPAENPLISTLASPSSSKSVYFDPNQASPFPFGLDLQCPAMHGTCVDCIEMYIMNSLQGKYSKGIENMFPVRCPACLSDVEESDKGTDRETDRLFGWEIHDFMAEKILGPQSLDMWRQRRAEHRKIHEAINEPQIIRKFDDDHVLIEEVVVLKAVEVEIEPPKITPASLQSGAIWITGRELDSREKANLAHCKICMEATRVVTYPVVASQLAPRRQEQGIPAYGVELECPQSHAFCADCLTKYVKNCMNSAKRGSKSVVMCPACAGDMAAAVSGEAEEWEEGRDITDKVAAKFLEDNDLARWKAWKGKVATRSNRALTCPNSTCGKDLEIPVTKQKYEQGQCPECESKVCLECRVPWHEGFTCFENMRLNSEEDKLFFIFAKKRLLRRCPKCQMVLGKDADVAVCIEA